MSEPLVHTVLWTVAWSDYQEISESQSVSWALVWVPDWVDHLCKAATYKGSVGQSSSLCSFVVRQSSENLS
jgi:hypothetical protein